MSPPALSYRALSRQGRSTWLAKFTLVLPFARSSPVESPSGPKPPPSPRYVSRADHVVTKRAPDCPRLRGSVAPWLRGSPLHPHPSRRRLEEASPGKSLSPLVRARQGTPQSQRRLLRKASFLRSPLLRRNRCGD